MDSKRIIWIDILNIVACMGVLLLHSTNREVHHFTGEISLNWIIGLCTHSFMLWPVNVFFMLSGFTLIKSPIIEQGGVNKFFKRRLNRLLIPVLSWNIFYMVLNIVLQLHKGNIIDSPITIISKFLSFQYGGYMWFFIPLICLYLSMPFLSLFVLNARKSILKFFIIMYVVMNAIGCLGISHGLHFYDIYIFGSRFLLFAVAGYYLGNYDLSIATRRRLYALGLISVMVILLGTFWLQLNIPHRYNFFLKYTNIPCTISSFAVFVFCKYTDWVKILNSIKVRESWLTKLSTFSLGIYLFQALGFSIIGKVECINNHIVLKFILMYVLCTTVIMIIKRIPLINKIV